MRFIPNPTTQALSNPTYDHLMNHTLIHFLIKLGIQTPDFFWFGDELYRMPS